MKTLSKAKLIAFVGFPFLMGLSYPLWRKFFSEEIAFGMIILTNIVFIFIVKAFLAKDLKNDEMEKKIATLSDAIAGRTVLILILLYGLLYSFNFGENFLSAFKTWQILSITLGIMFLTSFFASIYYTHHPEKL